MGETSAERQQQILPLVEHLSRLARRAIDSDAAPGGIRPRHLIALELLGEHGPVGQQTLADALCLDPSNVVGLLNELEERGLISRRRDPADRRRHIVELSPTGSKQLAAAYRRFRKVEDAVLASLSVEERSALYELLHKAVGPDPGPCTAGDAGGECCAT